MQGPYDYYSQAKLKCVTIEVEAAACVRAEGADKGRPSLLRRLLAKVLPGKRPEATVKPIPLSATN